MSWPTYLAKYLYTSIKLILECQKRTKHLLIVKINMIYSHPSTESLFQVGNSINYLDFFYDNLTRLKSSI